MGLGFGVWDLGFGVWGLGFGVWGVGCGVWGVMSRFRGACGWWERKWGREVGLLRVLGQRGTRGLMSGAWSSRGEKRREESAWECLGEAQPLYRVTAIIRKRTPLGPYRKSMPRVLGGFLGGWAFSYT